MSLQNDRISIDSAYLSENNPALSLLDLPNELILLIASDLGATDIYHLSLSNRRLCSLLQTPLFDLAIKLEADNINDPDIYHGRRHSALSHAVCLGRTQTVDILLSKGADITFRVRPHAKTPLHFAVELGHTEIVKSITKQPLGMLALHDSPGMCPIHYAAQLGHEEIVRIILDTGTDVDSPAWGPDEPGATALHYAARYGHLGIVKLLIERGAVVDVRTSSSRFLLNCWHIPMYDLGQTPLLWVVSGLHVRGNVWWKVHHPRDMLELLISYGADVNSRNELGKSALHCAMELGVMGVDLCLASTLLELGADPTLLTRGGDTALEVAVTCYYGADRNSRKFMRRIGWKQNNIKVLEAAAGGKLKDRFMRYLSWVLQC